MDAVQAAFTIAGIVGLAAVLAGLFARRLLRACYAWDLYLVSVVVAEVLILTSPHHFYTWTFWSAKETAYGLLKLAIALELGLLTLGAFPGGRHRAQQLTLALLTATAIALALPTPGGPVSSLALELQPRLANATALLFAAVWLLVLWYRVPLHRIHRAILRGLTPYLLVFTIAARIRATFGVEVLPLARWLDSTSYVALCFYWAWEAWRRAPETVYPEALAPYLGWRARFSKTD